MFIVIKLSNQMKISNIYFNKAYSILDNTLLNVIDNIVLRLHMKIKIRKRILEKHLHRY